MALAVAEEACGFEHRDLHWGNLLLQRGAPPQAACRLRCAQWFAECPFAPVP